MENTISAISTPIGTGGISVVRISGKEAFAVAEKIFRSKTQFKDIKSHTVTYGKIVDQDENIIDIVMMLKMSAPKTYTGEDTVEIQCHGGQYVTNRILEITYANGAVPAEPGEYTKRAFLNGQMDLMEAEAVMDLIASEAEDSYRDALTQLKGDKSQYIREIRQELINLLSHIMVLIDYPEYDIDSLSAKETKDKAEQIKEKLGDLSNNFNNGRIIRDGLTVAVIGEVNVGKSTFINKACGHNRVIVTDIAGTTRDVVEVKIDVNGLCVILKDTAGIRNTDNLIEKIGIEKSKEAIEDADAVIYIEDINKSSSEEILTYIKDMKKAICVLNKTDLLDKNSRESYISKRENELKRIFGDRVVSCSLDKKEGIDEIFSKLLELVNRGNVKQNGTAITNIRHKKHIDNAIEYLNNIRNSDFIDMMSVDLTCAADELGKITGETASTDIIQRIFERFCVGK